MIRPIVTDVARSVVSVSVCRCVGHVDVLCKNGWTDQDTVWGLTLVGPRNHVLYGGPDWTNPFSATMGYKSACGLLPNYFRHLLLGRIVAIVAYSYRWSTVVSLYVCVCVSQFVNPAKPIDPIEMPFGGWLKGWLRNPRNHVSHGDPDPPRGRGNFGGCSPHRKALGAFAVVYTQKQLNRSWFRLGANSCGPKELCIRWGWATPRIGAILWVVRPIQTHGQYLLPSSLQIG